MQEHEDTISNAKRFCERLTMRLRGCDGLLLIASHSVIAQQWSGDEIWP